MSESHLWWVKKSVVRCKIAGVTVHAPHTVGDGVFVTALKVGIKKDQRLGYFKEVFRVLKPGIGWIQVTEPIRDLLRSVTGKLPSDSAYREVVPSHITKLTNS